MSGVVKRRQATPIRSRRRSKIYVCFVLFAAAYVFVWWSIDDNLSNDLLHDSPLLRVTTASGPADAYLNNFPLRLRDSGDNIDKTNGRGLRDETFHSSAHCVGETHNETTAWKHRSCKYVHLCVDFAAKTSDSEGSSPEFFVVASRFDQEFSSRFHPSSSNRPSASSDQGRNSENNNKVYYSSTGLGSNVALGAIDPSWERLPDTGGWLPYGYGFDKIRWAPRVYNSMPSKLYYELDSDVVMVPFHAMAADNVGHLLWDNFLPLYNLLRIFGFDQNDSNGDSKERFRHLLIRVDTLPPLSATCDLRPKKKEACRKSFEKFLPLFGVDPNTFTTSSQMRLTKHTTTETATSPNETPATMHPVCSKHAVAGMGWLSDHGIRESHGWMMNHETHSLDVALAKNLGRGPELYAFRNFMLRNMGLEPIPNDTGGGTLSSTTITFRILLSAHSSTYTDRSFGLEEQHKALAEAFPTTEIVSVTLADLPLREQLELLSQPKQPREHIIFVSANGGGTMTAYFLPKGSSMILYYNERGGRDYFSNNKNTGGQAILDWDLMNNLGYVRTHWLPTSSMNEAEGLDALVYLVRHEMDATMNGLYG